MLNYQPRQKPIFKEGETAILDKGFRLERKVMIVRKYGTILCTVREPEQQDEDAWDVLISRLSKTEQQATNNSAAEVDKQNNL